MFLLPLKSSDTFTKPDFQSSHVSFNSGYFCFYFFLNFESYCYRNHMRHRTTGNCFWNLKLLVILLHAFGFSFLFSLWLRVYAKYVKAKRCFRARSSLISLNLRLRVVFVASDDWDFAFGVSRVWVFLIPFYYFKPFVSLLPTWKQIIIFLLF